MGREVGEFTCVWVWSLKDIRVSRGKSVVIGVSHSLETVRFSVYGSRDYRQRVLVEELYNDMIIHQPTNFIFSLLLSF